jgi:hypothetical protein
VRQKPKTSSSSSAAKKKQPGPVYRAIKQPRVAAPEPQPGDIGQAAVAAAALHQLNRYARDVQDYLNSSKMRSLVTRIEADMQLDPPPRPRMRIRRD